MKTKLLLSTLLSFYFCLLSSQIPQGFNYQALATDDSGNPLINKYLQAKISILSDTILPVIVWEELYSTIKTTDRGIFSLVVGSGVRQSASSVTSFSDIDWTKTPLYLKTQIFYQGSWRNMGSAKLWSVPYSMVAGDLGGTLDKLKVKGQTASMDSALFEVKNNNGQTVFAVYNEGVRAYVDDGAKSAKGGFAIGGFGTDKGNSQKYLFVSADSIRAYINDKTKSAKGGFAIGGFSTTKGAGGQFMNVATDPSGIINPSQNRILWYPLKNAFLTGRILIESPDSVGTNSFASGYESKSIGQYSQSLGYQAIARGPYSTSIGYQSVANKDNSFAFGQWAQAKNQESYAFGKGAIAEGFRSFAFGSAGVDSLGKTTGVAYAKGDYSFAIGQGSQSLGFGSFAFGLADTARGTNSFAMGYKSSANYAGSLAFGIYTTSSGFASTTFGYKTVANNNQSMAIGGGTVASGASSFAMGNGSQAGGWASAAFGNNTVATGDLSFAIGCVTKATGGASFAAGNSTLASGDNSAVFGFSTNASGNCSSAIGNTTVASGASSFAMGNGSLAGGWASAAFGNATVATGDLSFSIGANTKAIGGASFAAGISSQANAASSAAFGLGTKGNSYAVLVLGRFNDTTGMTNPNWYIPTDPAFEIGNGTSNTDRRNAFTVLQNGNTAIGHTAPTQMLDVNGNARFRAVGSGTYAASLAITSDGTLTTSTSDISMKKDIIPINQALQKVLEMKGVYFSWKNDNPINRKVGFIAQDMEKVLPEVVFTNPVDGLKGINYPEITAVLAQAVKEQQQVIEKQQSEINHLKSLEDEVSELKKIVNNLIANQTRLSDK